MVRCIFFNFAYRLCTSHHRLQAELEEAREEARIKAQEEIVVRIQEAKVITVTGIILYESTISEVNLCLLLSSRRPLNRNCRNRGNSTRNESHISMKPW